MAVTQNKKQVVDTQKGGQAPNLTPKVNPYAGMVGVSQNTAQHVGQAQQGWKPGESVTAAQNVWNQIQEQKPGEYQSQYGGMLDNILQQIQNPQEFKYEFNGDNLFKAYADLYGQKAKQGMIDTMGQAAALNGGYGTSYGQTVGQQQYQQNMLGLYDKGLELYDRARQAYQDQQNGLKDQYELLSDREQTDYNRYRDQYNDWQQQEQTAYGRYQDAQSFDYNLYQNDLNYWTGLAQVENQAYQTEQQRQDALEQYKQQYAWQQCQAILANGHMPSAALLAAAGLSAEDAAAMMAVLEVAAPSGGGGGSSGPSTTGSKPTGTNYQQATSEVQANSLAHNPTAVQAVQQNLNSMPATLQNAILQAAQNTVSNPNTSQAVQNLITATTSGVNPKPTSPAISTSIADYYGWTGNKKKK